MRVFLFILLVLMTFANTSAQNLLSPIWKYNSGESLSDNHESEAQEVNLLLSWERQGLSGFDGEYVLYNEFEVLENEQNLLLEFSIQADVKEILVNDIRIAGAIQNSFWTANRGKRTSVALPDTVLHDGAINRITMKMAHLSYTGGISHNYCGIVAAHSVSENEVDFVFPTQNHVYATGSDKKMVIASLNDADHQVHLQVKNDFHELFIDELIDLKSGVNNYVFDFSSYHLKPGFYECTAISKNPTYCSTVAWFAIAPEEISSKNLKVAHFDQYWKEALGDLEAVAPEFEITKVDSLCSATRDGFVVAMQSLDHVVIRGYYFVPKTKGKHPVVLHLPGYGYGFENLDVYKNRQSNTAELALCVRGHGISKEDFDPWAEMSLWAVNICDKDAYVYRSMYMDCVRAVDFLYARPEIDSNKIGVVGGSQGGGLALATAGLRPSKIAACGIFDPFLCNIREQAQIRTVVIKELNSFIAYEQNNCDLKQVFSVLDLIDTKHFATSIQCPVYFAASLFDDDCPPYCGFSAYHLINAPKSFEIYPNDSHLGESGQYSILFDRVEEMMKKH